MNNNAWYKVDNVANIFLTTYTKRDTRSLRVSCTLKDMIDPEILQRALNKTIVIRPQFQVTIKKGIFWHYMDSTNVRPKIEKENDRPCPMLYGENYREPLHYKVTYYHKRINLDLFHAITDGTGAMEFLNILVHEYLKLKNPGKLENVIVQTGADRDSLEQDSYKHFRNKLGKSQTETKKSYRIHSMKLPYNQLQFFEVHLPVKDIIRRAKEMDVTVTSYLGSVMMMAISEDMPLRQRKYPVTISMPVNLRNYYPSDTSRNFFNNVYVSHTFNGDETLEELAKEFQVKLKEALTPDKIKAQMSHYASLQELFVTRMIPLFIKAPVLRFFNFKENKNVSAILSNLGSIKVAAEMEQYIDFFSACCSTDGFFITVTSYKDEMVLGVSSSYISTGVLKNIVRHFSAGDMNVKVCSTHVVR